MTKENSVSDTDAFLNRLSGDVTIQRLKSAYNTAIIGASALATLAYSSTAYFPQVKEKLNRNKPAAAGSVVLAAGAVAAIRTLSSTHSE